MTHNLVYNVVMIKANIADVKAHLSQYLRQVKEGETLIICERNVPVYEVRPIAGKPRPLGFAKGEIRFLPGWDDPMTEEELALWEGR
jgi:antitoxin (DNA-binding transcriptional repressor) of toxin-antitoxin stability system